MFDTLEQAIQETEVPPDAAALIEALALHDRLTARVLALHDRLTARVLAGLGAFGAAGT